MDDNKGQRITLDELIDEVRISFRANVSLEAWEKIKPILASDSIHIWEDTTSLNKELQQLRAERKGLMDMLQDALCQGCCYSDQTLNHGFMSAWENIFAWLGIEGCDASYAEIEAAFKSRLTDSSQSVTNNQTKGE